MNKQKIIEYEGTLPQIACDVYISEGVAIIGDVKLEEGANVWFNSVLRGDIEKIHVGKYTNIQDNCTVHVMGDCPAIIGDYVTVGHGAIVHGCTVENNCLIGMGAILLGYCKIGENSIIAAGSVVTEGKIIPPNSMVMGIPGKVVRQLNEKEIEDIRKSALHYYDIAQKYAK